MQQNLTCALSGLLGSFSAFDVVELIHGSRKSGQLLVFLDKFQRQIFFQEGEIVFASSNLKEDRLGESLVRSGRISQEQLQTVNKRITPDLKLGRLLVEEEILTPGQLWIGVKNQVEEIFYSSLKMKKGEFTFYEGQNNLENIVRLSRSVRSLILEGVREIDELKIFVEKVINRNTIFLPLNCPPDLKLTEVEEEILQAVDGKKTVRKILRDSSTSPFVTFKALSNLMLARVVMPKDLIGGIFANDSVENEMTLKDPQIEKEEIDEKQAILSLIQRYNDIYIEIHRLMMDCGFDLQFDVNEYFSESKCPFAGFLEWVDCQPDGSLDGEMLLQFFSRMAIDEALDMLKRALEDLLFFLLFKSQDYLPKNISDSLIQTLEDKKL